MNRWYRLVRAGIGTDAATSRLRAVLKDMHEFASMQAAQERREELVANADQARRSVAAIERTQEKVEWVEIFVIAVYSIYLVHYLGSDLGFDPIYRGWCTLIGSVVAAALAALTLKPWRPYSADVNHARRGIVGSVVCLLGLIGLLIGAYIAVGFMFFLHGTPPAH